METLTLNNNFFVGKNLDFARFYKDGGVFWGNESSMFFTFNPSKYRPALLYLLKKTNRPKFESKMLIILGVGFRFRRLMDCHCLHLLTGRGFKIFLRFPLDVYFFTKKRRLLMISSNRASLHKMAIFVKGLRFPDAYKGKGFKFFGERLTYKEGKKRQR